jgi:hypothetical protein
MASNNLQEAPSGWVGWIAFAGIMMILDGAFQFIILVGISAIANLAFLTVYPVWSIVVITVDVLIIYALIVHGGELRESAV